MAFNCGIGKDFIIPAEACNSKPARGVQNIAYLINYEEWAKTLDPTNGNLITAITPKDNGNVYKLESRRGELPEATSDGNGDEGFVHSFVYTAPISTAELENEFLKGLFGAYVLIQPLANRTIRVFGEGFGLEITNLSHNFTETGTPVITFATNTDQNNEPFPPFYFDVGTGYDDSLAALEALLTENNAA